MTSWLRILLLVAATANHIYAQQPQPRTVLIVLTHADDPIAIAPLVAKYAAEDHRVYYALFTGVQDSALARDDSDKRAELRCAAQALGVRDAFVMSGPIEGAAANSAIAKRLIEINDAVKPDVVITWGPEGLTGHPRHILVGVITTRCISSRLA